MLPGLVGLAAVVVLGGAFVWASNRLSNWIYRRTAGGRKTPLRQRLTARKVPFHFAARAVPGQGALAAWETAKTEGRGLPVIVGGEFGLTRIIEAYDGLSHIRPETILAQADAITDPLPVRGRRKKPGDWPETAIEGKGPTVNLRLHGEPLDEVHLVFVPARTAADIPAFLRLGGWNGCPEAALMVAALRKWQKEYGAELVGISPDTMDLRVTRRPQTQAEALKLAREQQVFCADVMEGDDDLTALAATLMVSDWWFFWWD